MTEAAAEAYMIERWARMQIPENWHSMLTQDLPVSVVSQDVEMTIASYTEPDDLRTGCIGFAFMLGDRENPDLTPAEAEYVCSTLLSVARRVLHVYGQARAS